MAASAVVVGFMAGFFGIGGGLIMVPILFYIFSFVGIEQTFIMHLAIGTSFSIIIPTSIISTMTHMKFKAVDLIIVKTFGTFVAIGVVLGTIFAVSLKTSSLVLFFSIMTMFFGIYFLTAKAVFGISIDLGYSIENIAFLCAIYTGISILIVVIFQKSYKPIIIKNRS